MTPRVREILDNYGSDSPGTLTNLARLLNHLVGSPAGFMILMIVERLFRYSGPLG